MENVRKYDFCVSQKHRNPNLSCPNQKATSCLRRGWIQEAGTRQFLSLGYLEAEHGLEASLARVLRPGWPIPSYGKMPREPGAWGPRRVRTSLRVSKPGLEDSSPTLLWPEGKTRQNLSRNPSPQRKQEGYVMEAGLQGTPPLSALGSSGLQVEQQLSRGPRACPPRLATPLRRRSTCRPVPQPPALGGRAGQPATYLTGSNGAHGL